LVGHFETLLWNLFNLAFIPTGMANEPSTISSFPRKRESSSYFALQEDSRFRGNDGDEALAMMVLYRNRRHVADLDVPLVYDSRNRAKASL
jgi:hypothetical protein